MLAPTGFVSPQKQGGATDKGSSDGSTPASGRLRRLHNADDDTDDDRLPVAAQRGGPGFFKRVVSQTYGDPVCAMSRDPGAVGSSYFKTLEGMGSPPSPPSGGSIDGCGSPQKKRRI